jgi:hypothetical protein
LRKWAHPEKSAAGFHLGTEFRAASGAGSSQSTACSFERRAALAQEPARSLQDVNNFGKRSRVQSGAGILGFPVVDHAIVRRDQALLADAGGDDLSRHRVTYRAKDFDNLIA